MLPLLITFIASIYITGYLFYQYFLSDASSIYEKSVKKEKNQNREKKSEEYEEYEEDVDWQAIREIVREETTCLYPLLKWKFRHRETMTYTYDFTIAGKNVALKKKDEEFLEEFLWKHNPFSISGTCAPFHNYNIHIKLRVACEGLSEKDAYKVKCVRSVNLDRIENLETRMQQLLTKYPKKDFVYFLVKSRHYYLFGMGAKGYTLERPVSSRYTLVQDEKGRVKKIYGDKMCIWEGTYWRSLAI